ncbi:conserved hypothetical protein [Vibrio harveyi]|uniref:hypothetical protein n=1 Tax=Vibrio harveyi TaxID=669 RepID=UPI001EFDFD2E|nr:hypothetical protein [Vibrio harveyi]MCG9237721.1 hypothetical protein [Vibrio harveyi]MCG9585694.1 hypothetical protein [Vibrio harveyi]CAH1235003.1 conserved hypothetical protein [Vibrio harveyi]CAH1568531.1 conserved hypothetical protein [Vibrio harveyi]CAH1574656.1 conserved hypothetical protein [Vibrio harveyi]
MEPATLAAGVTLIDFLNKSLDTLKLVQQDNPDSSEMKLHLATLTQQLSLTMVEAAQLQGQLAQKNEEIRQLKQALDERLNVKYDAVTELYWAEDDPSPFCRKCKESDDKLIHLAFRNATTGQFARRAHYACTVCKSNYYKIRS